MQIRGGGLPNYGASLGGPQLAPPAIAAPFAAAPVAGVLPPVAPAPLVSPFEQAVAAASSVFPSARNAQQGMSQGLAGLDEANAAIADSKRGIAGARASGADQRAAAAGQFSQDLAAAQPDYSTHNADMGKRQGAYERDTKAAEDARAGLQYDKRSDGQKVMGILGTAFAGVGDALSNMTGRAPTNTLQTANELIHRSIQEEWDRDNQAVEGLDRKAGARLQEMQVARSMFQDKAQQFEHFKALRQEQYAAQVEAIAANTQNAELKASYEGIAAENRKESNATRFELFKELELQHMRDEANIKAASFKAQLISPELGYKIGHDAQTRDDAAAAREIPGLTPTRPLHQVTDAQYKAAAEAQKTYGQLKSQLEEMSHLVNQDYSMFSMHPKEQYEKLATADAQFKLKREQGTAMLTQAAGSGVPGAQEALRIFEGLPTPSAFAAMDPVDRKAVYDSAIQTTLNLGRIAVETGGAYSFGAPPKRAGGGKPAAAGAPAQDTAKLHKKYSFTPVGS